MAGPSTGRGDGVRVFLGYLMQAHAAAWNPPAQWLSGRSGIPKTTVESLINGTRKRLPDWTEQAEPLLRAYRQKVEDDRRGDPDAVLGGMAAWKQAYDDAQNGRPLTCPLPAPAFAASPAAWQGPGRLIDQVRPLQLEVHPAIHVGTCGRGLEELPAYIPRAHDETLAEAVHEVQAGASRLVVLVGGSSTGKTRALWEAVKSLPAPWRLWHPIDPGRPAAVLAELPQVGPHTVVWLNEAQHYLLTADAAIGEQVAGGLREVLRSRERGPVLVLGTLWPAYWKTLTAVPDPGRPDPYAQARELIKNASIRLPESFTGTDLDAAHRCAQQEGDSRLAEALRRASAGRLTQYLAGGPALLERYDNAEPAARAILDAAIDARRLGHSLALPRLLLEQAAPGYLSEEEWDLLNEDWLERAFAYLTDHRPCRGARPPLSRIRPRPAPGFAHTEQSGEPSYRLADYLEQHGTRTRRLLCPPAAFWDAATCHAATMSDHRALAQAARDRGRYRYAFALYQAAADAGDTSVLRELAEMREEAGDHAGAERLARAAAGAGDTHALWELARTREEGGDRAGAERLYQAAVDTGRPNALRHLARMREEAGDHAGAERLARAAAGAGDTHALWELARTREGAGDRAGAERLYQAAVDAGDPYALWELARAREEGGDRAGAERLYQAAVDTGDPNALRHLARTREWAGDQAGAERLYQAAVDAGDPDALWELARMREEGGDRAGAERLYQAAVDAGDPDALRHLARTREWAGDQAGAERLARAAVDAGDPYALWELTWAREEGGDRAGAERLARAAADAGEPNALLGLAGMRGRAGDQAGAERLYQAAADAGDPDALWELARMREEVGDRASAERLARAAADAGEPNALLGLAGMRGRAGDQAGAERLYQAAADTGDPNALLGLAVMREEGGDHASAERLYQAAVDAGEPDALRHLTRIRAEASGGRWADLLRLGLEADGSTAAPW
ncbi:hypothetical protein ACWDR1_29010 [Streptosporangium sandarakinum]